MLRKPYCTVETDNGKVEIYGNGHIRPEIYAWDLTPSETDDLGLDENDLDSGLTFFRYKGNVYRTDDFVRIGGMWSRYIPNWQKGFDGYMSDSFFSGILVRWKEIPDTYGDFGLQVYTYIAS